MPVELPRASAIHPGRLDDLIGDASQAGQVERHDIACELPGRGNGDRQGTPRHVRGPGETKVLKANALKEEVDARGGLHEPAPGHTGDDGRDGKGQQDDAAKEVLALDVLVQQHSQQKAKDDAL